MLLKAGEQIAIVGCSNAQLTSYKKRINELLETIKSLGLIPVCSNHIFEKYSVFSGTGKERADALMNFYIDDNIKAIFDISGGDVANEVLEYLDFDVIFNHYKPFFGYSDLTTIINSIYAMTGSTSYLYQIRNLIYNHKTQQIEWFSNSLLNNKDDLYDIKYKFLRGNSMEGIVIGGNIRCFLKLAGTPYMPNFDDKILLLEGYGGEVALMTTYLSQLKLMGAFKKIKGILLGTFTEMEQNNITPTMEELVLNITENENLPIVKTYDIGHGTDSKCIRVGEYLSLDC
ncbi:S66 family peptidase [Inconstantimicrobium mannanitabidum]|uniref:LD-carboxypeptidase n=1 Tax=Inconstantimicrobium mannanitabidum TaxID=1604901 RepID=A0ACB5R8J3_9CLOT|nr:S66 peptidase family protein [Clostridium sp. TW13]GKX65351.1 LD-carboxypeptidase [Clostridium sp. TW13]